MSQIGIYKKGIDTMMRDIFEDDARYNYAIRIYNDETQEIAERRYLSADDAETEEYILNFIGYERYEAYQRDPVTREWEQVY